MILLDATPLQSEHRFRGVGTYTLQLSHALYRLVPDQIRFAASSKDLALLPENLQSRAIVARRGHRPAQMYWMYNEFFLRKVIRNVSPSIFHATDFNGLVRTGGIPTIATLHDTTVLKEGLRNRSLSGRMSDFRWWLYYYKKLPNASHVIAVSDAVKKDAIELLGIRSERITVIPHGVDLTFYGPQEDECKRRQNYLLFVGGRNENKNLMRVLESLAELRKHYPTLSLLIAGAWSNSDLHWLSEQTLRLGIEQIVQHLGYVPNSELPSLYTNCIAFLFPSLEEGFGLPLLEAMACGAPVITSKRGAMKEVAGNAAILINPERVEEMTLAIRELFTKSVLRSQMIERGYKRVAKFSWSAAAIQTLEVYDRVRARPAIISPMRRLSSDRRLN